MITSINNEKNFNLGRHCGKKTRQNALVTGDYAVLTFHTDANQESKGFLLSFSAIPEGKLNKKKQTDCSGAKSYQERDTPEGNSHIKRHGCLLYLLGVNKAVMASLGKTCSFLNRVCERLRRQ